MCFNVQAAIPIVIRNYDDQFYFFPMLELVVLVVLGASVEIYLFSFSWIFTLKNPFDNYLIFQIEKMKFWNHNKDIISFFMNYPFLSWNTNKLFCNSKNSLFNKNATKINFCICIVIYCRQVADLSWYHKISRKILY